MILGRAIQSTPFAVGLAGGNFAFDARTSNMTTKHKFSPVRVAVVAQIASLGFAVWFMFFSKSVACFEPRGVGCTVCLIQSVNSGLLVVAVVLERKWILLLFPLMSWVWVCVLVIMSIC